ncbi:ADYC domain-containing protein [Polyangium aurulentum]|uniref:ADYC domain-containing protein n=1 Tax=Polyangium aurulentum TaxID=2567896 RepID=UPI0010ADE9B7|nr:ADYC domain-containing protein [Polyangium aurulentum]UQA59432.1 pentapeptide repeat-containing protein [Polyangium aurulentum]
MHATKSLGLVLTMMAAWAGGCSPDERGFEEEETPEATRAALASGNGTSVNGTSVNGTSINGTSINGTSINGTSINGTTLNGTLLVGFSLGGLMIKGMAFVGTQMNAHLDDGSVIKVRIDAIDLTADPEIFLYTVKYRDKADGKWKSICGNEPSGQPRRAIPLRGIWDYSEATPTGGSHIDSSSLFTFACEGSTLAKCVNLGYKPWKVVTECKKPGSCHDVSLSEVHQACVRMVRADYCGDGMSHTTNGISINLWDSFKIQKPKPGEPGQWVSEAEWSPGGAICIDGYRFHEEAAKGYVELRCPERIDASFACFGGQSTFDPKYGYPIPLDERSVLRNEYDANEKAVVIGGTRED